MFDVRGAYVPGSPVISPDKKSYLLLTQRGVLATNHLEATVWILRRQAILEYLLGNSIIRPTPKAIATLSAESNTPVISDVRWLEDSRRIAFLGKNNSSHQQLFIVDSVTGVLTTLTKEDIYVSGYDIKGSTVAYTALVMRKHDEPSTASEVVSVIGKDLYSLLYPKREDIADLLEDSLWTLPSELHIQRNGQELPVSFVWGNKPLMLFAPVLALSPDENFLITVAPVRKIPPHWAGYQVWAEPPHSSFELRPDNDYALADDNPEKASQYVVIDLQSDQILPLIDAPVGRGLFYVAPVKAFWLSDSHHAILSNTFLPLDSGLKGKGNLAITKAPALLMIDIGTHKFQAIASVQQSRYPEPFYHLDNVSWIEAFNQLILTYASESGDIPIPKQETYGLRPDGVWTKNSTKKYESDIQLSVDQDLNEAPVLAAWIHGRAVSAVLWDPNPQLDRLTPGKASIYHWQDKDGNRWTGILVLPPNYDPAHRYPLVIQTHGYHAGSYFVDGEYTTGSGGRALASKGIVVLQMDMPTTKLDSPDDGPFEVAGFEAAVNSLAAAGMADSARVGVVGFSYTCFHVLYAMTHRPDLFAAASITDGNNMSYLQYIQSVDSTNGFQRISVETNGSVPFGKGLQVWAQNAPGFNLDQTRTPLLISAFERGELLAQWEIYAALRTLRKPVDMIWFRKEDAPHILVKPLQRYVSQQGAVDWFDFWLNGREDSDPLKSDQYARWRILRKVHEEAQMSFSSDKR